jgi:hypothetical protein
VPEQHRDRGEHDAPSSTCYGAHEHLGQSTGRQPAMSIRAKLTFHLTPTNDPHEPVDPGRVAQACWGAAAVAVVRTPHRAPCPRD